MLQASNIIKFCFVESFICLFTNIACQSYSVPSFLIRLYILVPKPTAASTICQTSAKELGLNVDRPSKHLKNDNKDKGNSITCLNYEQTSW